MPPRRRPGQQRGPEPDQGPERKPDHEPERGPVREPYLSSAASCALRARGDRYSVAASDKNQPSSRQTPSMLPESCGVWPGSARQGIKPKDRDRRQSSGQLRFSCHETAGMISADTRDWRCSPYRLTLQYGSS
jgi:hypothetical protein